jgi:hypothetical protein
MRQNAVGNYGINPPDIFPLKRGIKKRFDQIKSDEGVYPNFLMADPYPVRSVQSLKNS